jgi:hypothetical protein
MGTSHVLQTPVTDQSNNRKRLRSLLGPSWKSTNLQVIVAQCNVFVPICIMRFGVYPNYILIKFL